VYTSTGHNTRQFVSGLGRSRSKALLFCCTTCRRKGSIVNQLHKLRSDVTIEDGQQLASVRAVNEAREIVHGLRASRG